MRALLLAAFVGAPVVLGTAGAPAAAQDLESQIRNAGEDRVAFRYDANPNVRRCGDHSGWTRSRGGSWDRDCWRGPVEATLRLDGRSVSALDVEMVRPGTEVPRGYADLGTVSAEVAADYLLGLAGSARESVAEDAVGGAAMADAETWPQMLDLAKRRDLYEDVRSAATFWVGQASADRATEGLSELVYADDDELEVRQSAIFALSQQESVDAVSILMRVARDDLHPELKRSAFFWLGQHEDDPRVLPFFEEVLRGG